ncbi:MAG TPA: CopD family protein [Terriglobia bacterium]|nr:CopD family protein [Terriglobia bacterium]
MSTPLNWALVAHVIGIIYWLGGLVAAAHILMRLGNESSPEARAALGNFENKLLKRIVHPGAAVTVLAGIGILLADPEYLRQTWLHVKLALVVILIAVDLLLTARFRAAQAGKAAIEPKQAKLLYGSVAVLLFFIVVLAVLKPFS